MFFLTNVITHFQVLSVTFIECRQHVNKRNILQKKLFWEKCGVYETYVPDNDTDEVMLVWSFKATLCNLTALKNET